MLAVPSCRAVGEAIPATAKAAAAVAAAAAAGMVLVAGNEPRLASCIPAGGDDATCAGKPCFDVGDSVSLCVAEGACD